ncbi:flagellar motor protein MotB [Nissabacter sp. SGAir0207]|uniref:flagellar motor protein MotB n=1 Tax=Nissabacter sp. SGAir0207 TaxID=2126321 RepID=UPI0010CD1EBC|nr:flagellar motor protein MotB [Nissabacter sp. SGAir0207]QCR35760.1 motility protein MotB [Nissabacter sp. SGAir0207]
MKQQDARVVIKRKRAKHGGGHHGGSWKIAYADFMTAMMAFFLVMWLISIASPKELTQIAEYFRTPLKVALSGGQRSSDSESPIPGGGDDPTRHEGEVHKVVERSEKIEENARLQKLHEDLDQLLESDPRLRALRPHLLITLTEQGLRIQIIDSQNRPMFRTGSAQVEPYMRDILRAIGPILDHFPNKISLAGHTDDIPYVTGERGYSNWELSADRANASRRELVYGGLSEGKVLRVMGLAATMQLRNHEAGDAINRRISILVLNKEAQQNIERENSEGSGVTLSQPGALSAMTPAGQAGAPAATPPQTQQPTPVTAPAPAAAPDAPPSAALPAAPAGPAGQPRLTAEVTP